jgi:hypothetical protein
VVFIPQRGLPVADPSGRFTWLTAGIFVEICKIAAHADGFEMHVDWNFSPMYAGGDYETPQVVAQLRMELANQKVDDLDPRLILARQTSRLPYNGEAVPQSMVDELKAEAQRLGHDFEIRTDQQSIRWIVELNKQALFHDLDNKTLRDELTQWLRFSEREEEVKRDGLSARCLMISGPLLRSFFFRHYFWTLPIIRSIVGAVYGKTMRGIGTIGWLRGRYVSNEDWVHAGTVMIRLWLMVTRAGYYWHPYGSVITSEAARQNMIEYFQMSDERNGEDMVWLLLRLGKSVQPPQSYRLPEEDIVSYAS